MQTNHPLVEVAAKTEPKPEQVYITTVKDGKIVNTPLTAKALGELLLNKIKDVEV